MANAVEMFRDVVLEIAETAASDPDEPLVIEVLYHNVLLVRTLDGVEAL